MKKTIALLSLGLLLGSACTPETDENTLDNDRTNNDTANQEDHGWTALTPVEPIDPRQECAGIAAEADRSESPALGLSRAHAGIRFFGAQPSYRAVDLALAASLALGESIQDEWVIDYAARLDGVCALPRAASELGAVEIQRFDTVAWIRPGHGDVLIPDGVEAAVIDLRNLSAHEDLHEALANAVAPFLETPVDLLPRRVRAHTGLSDEYFSPQSIYSNRPHVLNPSDHSDQIVATGDRDLPIALLTDGALAPAAAELVYTLRLQQRAWILGAAVHAQTAESRLTPVTDEVALSWRFADLLFEGARVPDSLSPDGTTEDARGFPLTTEVHPPPVSESEPARQPIAAETAFGSVRPVTLAQGELPAALIAAHGAARTFYPYFQDVVDVQDFDSLLLEVLDVVAASSPGGLNRTDASRLLRRLSYGLHDGHAWVLDYGGDPAVRGWLALALEEIDGEPVVRRSGVSGVAPGDTIIAIDGEAAVDVFAREMARTYGATEGHRFQTAGQEVFTLRAPTMNLELRDTEGAIRAVDVSPSSSQAHSDIAYATSLRTSGWLDDLGAPDVYYVNLDGCCSPTNADLRDALANMGDAAGLVLDMRGHPASMGMPTYDPYELYQRLADATFTMLHYEVPTYQGPDLTGSQVFYDGAYTPLTNPHYSGPVILLIDARAVSFGDDMGAMFRNMNRGLVIGRQSASTTGSVTGLHLPGAFVMAMTGMDATWPDGTTFHTTGIMPDVVVPLTAEALAAGIDEDLAAAIEHLVD